MAHYAKVKNGIVTKVIVAEQDFINNYNDNEIGIWVQTSYNTFEGEHRLGGTPLRGNYASPGMIWDEKKDAFYHPAPHDNWVLNEKKWRYEPPIAMPTSTPKGVWVWNQEDNKWVDTQPNK